MRLKTHIAASDAEHVNRVRIALNALCDVVACGCGYKAHATKWFPASI